MALLSDVVYRAALLGPGPSQSRVAHLRACPLVPTPLLVPCQTGCTLTAHCASRARGRVISAAVASPPAERSGQEVQTIASYKKLQNGSDVRGVAIDGVEGEPLTLTANSAYFIGAALAKMLAERLDKPTKDLKISVGRDPRLSGSLLSSSIAAGAMSEGASVADFGLATTPAMFMSCILPGHDYDGAIIITASHLPYNRNGFKFFTKEGGFDTKDITYVLESAAHMHTQADAPLVLGADDLKYTDSAWVLAKALQVDGSRKSDVDFMPVYSQHLRNIIKEGINHPDHPDTPLKGFHILLDAGNGGGGFLATSVLEPLGASIEGSQFLEPDGWFPNHPPNPEDRAAMNACVRAVKAAKADLGIVVDTDVDRSAVVGSNGAPINSNRYIALMATITLRKYPGSTIVTDSVTSNGLATFIKGLGGKHYRYRRGYKNVISKGVDLNKEGVQTELMMETSGHGAMKENHFLDDGTYSASQIIIEMVKRRLEGQGDVTVDLLKDLQEPIESREFRLRIKDKDYGSVGKVVLDRFREWVKSGREEDDWTLESENYEGWRVVVDEGNGKQGWLLLRASLHDPLLVLNAESEINSGTCDMVGSVLDFFEEEILTNYDIDVETLYEGSSRGTLKFS
ncbi:hypothetical protein WJX73_007766 [Symbiochloris irregularis]|uniref:phosphoglucomutase (alpha-D-glucose-1,6-bisphosphate-dependent) n=1 Tax=Symbiochloris irregularis TaxID=706552 RepID=A0AAW1NUZ6_9CHLO